METGDVLRIALQNSLQPNLRKDAEVTLKELEARPGFVTLALNLVAAHNEPLPIRQAAALLLKNLVKRSWSSEDDSTQISEKDRILLKEEIVHLMIVVPPQIRVLLSEAVSIMAQYDFPEKWPQLIGQLVSKLSPTDLIVDCGVLGTAHSIFRRWRALYRSNELFTEIKFVLETFCPAFLELWRHIHTEFKATVGSGDVQRLGQLCEVLSLLVEVFYDLNVQDLPEFFEDNMQTFMSFMAEYLTTNVNEPGNDDEDATAMDNVKAGICSIVELYSRRYEDAFPMLGSFVETIWKLLITTGLEPRYDDVVSKGLSCLSTVVKLHSQRATIGNESVLRQFIEQIVLPNMTMRASDEERFEDDPIDYIRRDLEAGTDNDSRRSAATEFVRALMNQFQTETTQMISVYILQYLEEYQKSPKANWKAKDTAIYLLTSIASHGSSASGSVSTNQFVDVVDFFSKNIYSDLAPDANINPIIQVDAIRYLYTFRGLLTREQLLTVLPVLTKLLHSHQYAVHTFAAIAIERILFMRSNRSVVIAPADVSPFSKEILLNILLLIERNASPEKMAENDYLMKCAMRTIIASRETLSADSLQMLDNLNRIIAEVSKNPSNPRFNHYLFECVGGLVRFDTATPGMLEQFESRLFGPFQIILQLDITEFTPYVFQILAQLLEMHPANEFPDSYKGLVSPLMTPSLWDQRGNVPALTRLLIAFLDHGATSMVQSGQISSMLGIFQKLISSKASDQYGFDLLEAIFRDVPAANLDQYLKGIFFLLFTRLQNAGTDRFASNLTYIIFLYIALAKTDTSADHLLVVFDTIQEGVFIGLLKMVLLPQVKMMRGLARKITIVGMTRLLTTCSRMLDASVAPVWSSALNELLALLLLPPDTAVIDLDDLDTDTHDENTFQSAFSQLATAVKPKSDPLSSIADTGRYAIEMFRQLKQTEPGKLQDLMAKSSPELVQPFASQL